MKPLFRLVNGIEEAVISLLLVAMTLLVFFETVLRFVFNTGISWAQEATLLMSAWLVLFGASYGVKVGAHIGVDAFVRLLSAGPRRLVGIIVAVACLVYTALFMSGAWVYISKMYKIGIKLIDLPIPKWIAQSILLIGFALLAIRFLIILLRILTGRADGFTFADEAKEAMRLADEVSKGGETAK